MPEDRPEPDRPEPVENVEPAESVESAEPEPGDDEPALPARRRRTPMIVALAVIAVVVLGTAAAVVHADGRTTVEGTPKAFPYLPPSNLAIVDPAATKAVATFVTTAMDQVLSYDYRNPNAIQQVGKQFFAPGSMDAVNDLASGESQLAAQKLVLNTSVMDAAVFTLTTGHANVHVLMRDTASSTAGNRTTYQFAAVTVLKLDGQWKLSSVGWQPNAGVDDNDNPVFPAAITPPSHCGIAVPGTSTPSPNADLTEQQLADQRDLTGSDAQPLIEQLETHDPAQPDQALDTWIGLTAGQLLDLETQHRPAGIALIKSQPKIVSDCPDPAALVSLDLTKGTATVLDDSLVQLTSPTGTNTVAGLAELITMQRTATGWRATDLTTWTLNQDLVP